jgi:hypothetical protein
MSSCSSEFELGYFGPSPLASILQHFRYSPTYQFTRRDSDFEHLDHSHDWVYAYHPKDAFGSSTRSSGKAELVGKSIHPKARRGRSSSFLLTRLFSDRHRGEGVLMDSTTN